MLYSLPQDILSHIYSYDNTFRNEMKYVHIHIKNLSNKYNYVQNTFIHKLSLISKDFLLVSDSNLTAYSFEKKFPELYHNDPKVLSDNAFIYVESTQKIYDILRSNLLREYQLDGWQINIHS